MTDTLWTGTLHCADKTWTAEMRHPAQNDPVRFKGAAESDAIRLTGEKPEAHWTMTVKRSKVGELRFVMSCLYGVSIGGAVRRDGKRHALVEDCYYAAPPLPGDPVVDLVRERAS